MKNESVALNEMIDLLQSKQAGELALLKEQFYCTYESLKPINLIKNTIHELTESPDIKTNLLNSAIGLTTGFLSKKISGGLGKAEGGYRESGPGGRWDL